MKAIILIGGPAPAEDGNINTHMCVVWWPALTSTNRSLDMKLEYRETLTSPSPSPGWDMRPFTAHSLIGYVLYIVSSIFFFFTRH